jgi:hypothetical protein
MVIKLSAMRTTFVVLKKIVLTAVLKMIKEHPIGKNLDLKVGSQRCV